LLFCVFLFCVVFCWYCVYVCLFVVVFVFGVCVWCVCVVCVCGVCVLCVCVVCGVYVCVVWCVCVCCGVCECVCVWCVCVCVVGCVCVCECVVCVCVCGVCGVLCRFFLLVPILNFAKETFPKFLFFIMAEILLHKIFSLICLKSKICKRKVKGKYKVIPLQARCGPEGG